jgi:uncharacterized protein YpuA (DUF1002 family)
MMHHSVKKRIIFGLAALAGGYALYRKMTEDQRTQAKEWVEKVKEEIQENIQPFKDLTEKEYDRVAETAAYHYGRLYRVNAREFAAALDDLRADWARVRDELKETVEKSKKR